MEIPRSFIFLEYLSFISLLTLNFCLFISLRVNIWKAMGRGFHKTWSLANLTCRSQWERDLYLVPKLEMKSLYHLLICKYLQVFIYFVLLFKPFVRILWVSKIGSQHKASEGRKPSSWLLLNGVFPSFGSVVPHHCSCHTDILSVTCHCCTCHWEQTLNNTTE